MGTDNNPIRNTSIASNGTVRPANSRATRISSVAEDKEGESTNSEGISAEPTSTGPIREVSGSNVSRLDATLARGPIPTPYSNFPILPTNPNQTPYIPSQPAAAWPSFGAQSPSAPVAQKSQGVGGGGGGCPGGGCGVPQGGTPPSGGDRTPPSGANPWQAEKPPSEGGKKPPEKDDSKPDSDKPVGADKPDETARTPDPVETPKTAPEPELPKDEVRL